MYVLFFSQSQFQMLPDIFSANHIVGLHLIRPFYPITLQEPLWNHWLQFITNVCLFVSFWGFLRTLLPFWYAWVYICYKLQYCSLFSYFLNSVKKSVCTWTRKKNIYIFGVFCFLFFSFYNHCIYTGEIFVPFYFRPFHSFPPRCHAAGKFNYLRAVSSDPTGTFTKTHQEF